MATDRDLCKACDDLKYNAPHFVANGLTEQECQSLMNNTGLNPKANHDDCEDLHDMQDCLMEGLKEDIPTYDDCDWKSWATDLMTNLNNMLQALVCVVCGIWDEINRIWNAIQDLWNAVRKLQCILDKINNPRGISVPPGENCVAGPGVSWHYRIDGKPNPPVISGNSYCAHFGGSIHLDNSWLGDLPFNYHGEPSYISNGGRLLWRWKLKKSEYNIRAVWSCPCYTANVGTETHCELSVINEGDRAGSYNGLDHVGEEVVPEGYVFLDVRMHHAEHLGDGDITVHGVFPILMDNDFDC